jgi:hypothetical protein
MFTELIEEHGVIDDCIAGTPADRYVYGDGFGDGYGGTNGDGFGNGNNNHWERGDGYSNNELPAEFRLTFIDTDDLRAHAALASIEFINPRTT